MGLLIGTAETTEVQQQSNEEIPGIQAAKGTAISRALLPLLQSYQRNPKVTGNMPTVPVPMLLLEFCWGIYPDVPRLGIKLRLTVRIGFVGDARADVHATLVAGEVAERDVCVLRITAVEIIAVVPTYTGSVKLVSLR